MSSGRQKLMNASIRTVEQGAFFGCTALKTVDFAEGTTMIVKQAFQNCKSLEKVILPSSLVTIGSQAFSGTDSLVSVTYNGTSKEVLEYIDTLNLPEAPETPAGVSETEWNAMLFALSLAWLERRTQRREIVTWRHGCIWVCH